MKKVLAVLGVIIAAIFAVYYFAVMFQIKASLVPLLLICSVAAAYVLTLISRSAMRLSFKNPRYSALQKEQLAQAAAKDAETVKANERNEAAAKAEYKKNLPAVIDGYKESLNEKTAQLHAAAQELKKRLQAFSQMDALGNDDKNLNTIDSLIYFIETSRADSLKEALHEYDKAVAANQLAELEKQRVQLQQKLLDAQQQQMRQQREHQMQVEATLSYAAAAAERDRARQRDMIYVHCMDIESKLGSIASNSQRLSDMAEIYSSKIYY